MKVMPYLRALCLASWLPIASAAPELIDRVAVTVGNRAITESSIVEEVRLAAFLNAEKPKLDPASLRDRGRSRTHP